MIIFILPTGRSQCPCQQEINGRPHRWAHGARQGPARESLCHIATGQRLCAAVNGWPARPDHSAVHRSHGDPRQGHEGARGRNGRPTRQMHTQVLVPFQTVATCIMHVMLSKWLFALLLMICQIPGPRCIKPLPYELPLIFSGKSGN